MTIGPACSGSHFHAHDEAFCTLVHGLKYWVIRDLNENCTNPPVFGDLGEVERHHAYDPDPGCNERYMDYTGPVEGHLRALRHRRGKEWWRKKWPHQMECTQRPGDLIYVPQQYQHYIINLWPSAAMNHEFTLQEPSLPAPREARPGTSQPQQAPLAPTPCTDESCAMACWDLEVYDPRRCGGEALRPCWNQAGDTYACQDFAECGVSCLLRQGSLRRGEL